MVNVIPIGFESIQESENDMSKSKPAALIFPPFGRGAQGGSRWAHFGSSAERGT
jgi:hypothetical protein